MCTTQWSTCLPSKVNGGVGPCVGVMEARLLHPATQNEEENANQAGFLCDPCQNRPKKPKDILVFFPADFLQIIRGKFADRIFNLDWITDFF